MSTDSNKPAPTRLREQIDIESCLSGAEQIPSQSRAATSVDNEALGTVFNEKLTSAGFTPDMAAQSNRQDRVIHQDYIVRQRYSNALPPPPGAPKLLDIPTEGLAYYTSPAFASRLARQQPLNIEADAFLGMPIDLVGMPGIFDGDESCELQEFFFNDISLQFPNKFIIAIQAPLVPPPVHPRDRKLLRPLKSLGQPKTETSGVSFLRRTQYTADEVGRTRIDSSNSRNSTNPNVKRRRPTDASRDEPINVLRSVIKSFDIANPEDAYKGPDTEHNIRGAAPTPAEIEAWKNPQHPTNPKLKLVDAYPILPDLDAITDSGGYMVTKFAGNPSNATDFYDERMDVALLRPIDPTPEQVAEIHAKRAAHEADPVHYPDPGPPAYDYEFFLPHDAQSARNIKKKFDVDDPEKDDPSLYAVNENHKNLRQESFRYRHVRVYETGLQSHSSSNPYQDVALALYDPEIEQQMAGVKVDDVRSEYTRQKAAYYYPIVSKVQLKPRRSKHLASLGLPIRPGTNQDDEVGKYDAVDLMVRDPNNVELASRASHKANIDVQLDDEN